MHSYLVGLGAQIASDPLFASRICNKYKLLFGGIFIE